MLSTRHVGICGLLLVLASWSAGAQGVSPDALVGSYAFDFSAMDRDGDSLTSRLYSRSMGVIRLLPDGTVEGHRLLYHHTVCRTENNIGQLVHVEQSLSGTWSVDGNGIGTIRYSADPNPLLKPIPCSDDLSKAYQRNPFETIDFIPSQAGCSLILQLRATVYDLDQNGTPGRAPIMIDLAGTATRQDDRCIGSQPTVLLGRPAVPEVRDTRVLDPR